MTKKLTSLSIFFPFYNDEGTVERQLTYAYAVGETLTDNLEVIALHGGNSKDWTFQKILEMKKKYPELKIVDKKDNTEGYAVIKYGFAACTKDWIFYTDGDAQYHLEENLVLLAEKQTQTGVDVVNGYKKKRGDNFLRVFLGNGYAFLVHRLFQIPIRDVDCDFRLIRRSVLNRVSLEAKDSSILAELVKKLELVGARFVEIPVNHYKREYGTSNYTAIGLLKEKFIGDLKLFLKMKRLVGNKNKKCRGIS
ncbi:MAG: glycosyltransferase family 2 protein [Parcubacteria group bacterium]|nr:glycosyltransferase family 2 protein [Parcubacteria group bacterium]